MTSPDRLPASRLRFDALLARSQRDGRLPSQVAGLVADGRLVWVGGAGAVPGDDPADVQYRIGSITKTMTAVLVLQARDEGLLGLDEPLAAYVPEAAYADRTLRALLGHVAGLPGEPAGEWWERRDGGSFADLVAANAGVPAMAGPGHEFRYSNLGYGLLGEAVARVRGASWWDLVQDRILAPLGMTRTTYHPERLHAQGWSVSHLLGTLTPEPHTDTGAMAPAGQVWSTVADLARYADFVLHGHPDVLALSTLLEASVPQIEGGSERYGLGFRVLSPPVGELVGHTGSMPGFRAVLMVDRARGTGCVGFSNATVGQSSESLAVGLLTELVAASPEPVPPWEPAGTVPDEVRELVGPWYWGETAFEIRWNGRELELVETRDQSAYEEYTRIGGRWIGTDRTELEVVRTAEHTVSHLLSETYRFTRTPHQ